MSEIANSVTFQDKKRKSINLKFRKWAEPEDKPEIFTPEEQTLMNEDEK